MDLLGNQFETADGSVCSAERFEGKILGLYFCARWSESCRNFTPVLAQFYERHASAKNFEIILVSWTVMKVIIKRIVEICPGFRFHLSRKNGDSKLKII